MKNIRASVTKVVALAVVPLSLAVVVARVGQQRRAEAATIQLLHQLSQFDGLSQFEVHTPVNDLLAQGADANVSDALGLTPLLYAVDRSPRNVKILLAHGADVNARERREGTTPRTTPLMIAVNKADVQTVRLLLDHGANLHLLGRSYDLKKDTPLNTARRMLRTEPGTVFDAHYKVPVGRFRQVIELLKAAGAKE
jgi:hypothetical protein